MKQCIENVRQKIAQQVGKEITLMEVCGSHSMAMAEHGIRSLLPREIKVLSGPGCPVCVTDSSELYCAIELAKRDDTIIATFGDMLKVPCYGETLQGAGHAKVIFSPLEAVNLAVENPNKKIVLIGVGFETTTPSIAYSLIKARQAKLRNFFTLPMHKLVPPALKMIFQDPDIPLDGLILPGHVSAIMGSQYFSFIPDLGMSGVISGFSALDLMSSILKLLELLHSGKKSVFNNYPRAVSIEGNSKAREFVAEVYEEADCPWRKIGTIPGSGLKLRNKYAHFDAKQYFGLSPVNKREPRGCLCGDIMMGKKQPRDCKLFAKSCRPSNPIGPCMVSSEGSCAAVYKYEL